MGSYNIGTIWNPMSHDFLPHQTTISRIYSLSENVPSWIPLEKIVKGNFLEISKFYAMRKNHD